MVWNTGCRMVTNSRAQDIHIVDREDKRYTLTVPPNRGQRSFEGVIFPWCGSTHEIMNKAFCVHDGSDDKAPILFFIFQNRNNNAIYYSPSGKWEDIKQAENLKEPVAYSDFSFTVTADGLPDGNKTPEVSNFQPDRNTPETFELFTTSLGAVEHTYLKAPARGDWVGGKGETSFGGRYFQCWGSYRAHLGTHGIHRRSYRAYYEVANACRRSRYGGVPTRPDTDWYHDTAGVPLYAVNGVCHQSANLFLWSSGGETINMKDGTKGYLGSTALYGAHGTQVVGEPSGRQYFFGWWRREIYDPAWEAHGPRTASADEENPDVSSGLTRALRSLYQHTDEQVAKSNASAQREIEHELIHGTVCLLMNTTLPDVQSHDFHDLHIDILQKKDDILSNRFSADELSSRLNELVFEFQDAIAKRFGEETFRQMTGHGSDEGVQIVDPNILKLNSKRSE